MVFTDSVANDERKDLHKKIRSTRIIFTNSAQFNEGEPPTLTMLVRFSIHWLLKHGEMVAKNEKEYLICSDVEFMRVSS